MVLMHTPFCDTSFTAPDFSLKGTDSKTYSLSDIKGGQGTVVIFLSNHCPYVKAIIKRLVEDVIELQKNDIGVVAIMSNDTKAYPDDSFDNMVNFVKEHGMTFPYLIDETQEIARAYDALCTPDFFGFNVDAGLRYRGRLDKATPSIAHTDSMKHELLDAMLYIAKTGEMPKEQNPSMGCSIKWRNAA